MKFEIVTLFPDYFSLSLKQSLIGKAWDKQLFDIGIINPRDSPMTSTTPSTAPRVAAAAAWS